MKKAKTITGIAKLAGTSIATVSRAINPQTSHLVKKTTLKRILSIVHKTGFLPSSVAQRLATGRSLNIVIFIGTKYTSMFYADYYMKLLQGVMETLDKTPYNLIIRMLKLHEANCRIVDYLRGMDVAGAIVCDFIGVLQSDLSGVEQFAIPIVALNKTGKIKDINYIYCDSVQSAYRAAHYLVGLGHQRIAVVRGTYQYAIDRMTGFRKALKENGVSFGNDHIFTGNFTQQTGVKAVRKFMCMKERPTAIFCMNDEIAIGALEELGRMSVSCPGEVSVIGFDGIEAGRFFSPRLTTMRQPVYEMAREATQEILHILEGKLTKGATKVFCAELLTGDSCAAPQKRPAVPVSAIERR